MLIKSFWQTCALKQIDKILVQKKTKKKQKHNRLETAEIDNLVKVCTGLFWLGSPYKYIFFFLKCKRMQTYWLGLEVVGGGGGSVSGLRKWLRIKSAWMGLEGGDGGWMDGWMEKRAVMI